MAIGQGGAAAISGGLNILGGLFSGIGRKKRERRQHKRNLELADYQHQKDLDIWNKSWERETAYNDPKAQMERLRKAGINPHMAHSQGSVQNVASSGELPSYTQPEQQYNAPTGGEIAGDTLSKFVGTTANILQLKSMKENIKAQELDNEKTTMLNEVYARIGKESDAAKYETDYHDKKGELEARHMTYDKSGTSLFKRDLLNESDIVEQRKAQAEIQTATQSAIKAGIVSENDVKAYRSWLAKQKIDPNGGFVTEIMKMAAEAGIPLTQFIGGFIKSIIGKK